MLFILPNLENLKVCKDIFKMITKDAGRAAMFRNSHLIDRDKYKILLKKVDAPSPRFHPTVPALLNASIQCSVITH